VRSLNWFRILYCLLQCSPVWWNMHVGNCTFALCSAVWNCSLLSVWEFMFLQVVDMVLDDLKKEHPDAISVVWVRCSILFSSSITRICAHWLCKWQMMTHLNLTDKLLSRK
jgi:hypothetical protein